MEHHYTVDMPRGAVTIMEGFAANQKNHGVKSVRGKVASLLLRRMHPELLAKKWVANNTAQVTQAPSPPEGSAKDAGVQQHGSDNETSEENDDNVGRGRALLQ